jgi:hypothetical protein
MSHIDISRLENFINNEKQTLFLLEQQKTSLINNYESKKRAIASANERTLALPNSGPLLLGLLRESIELESVFSREKTSLEQDISNQRRIIEVKERELVQMKHSQPNVWSTSFK